MGQCKSALIAAMGPEEEYNVENADENGNTRLLLAAADGDVGLVRELLEKGANVHAVNANGTPATCLVAWKWVWPGHGHVEAMRGLVKGGADIDALDGQNGYNALMYAGYGANTGLIRVLIRELKASVNLRSQYNDSALALTIREGDSDHEVAALEILKSGAECSSEVGQAQGRSSPLILAVQMRMPKLAMQLANMDGLNIRFTDATNRSALMWAQENDMKELAVLLEKKGGKEY